MDLETSVYNENELNNTIEYYEKEGYNIKGHYNNKVILEKKGYSTTTLIILLLLGIILGVIYYAMNKNKHKLIISLDYGNYNESISKIEEKKQEDKILGDICCIVAIIFIIIAAIIGFIAK